MATVRTKGSNSTARRRSNAPPRWSVAALELVYELLTTTERLAAARHWDGRVVLRSDAAWSLLRMIERLPYCPSISDLGRLLHISRQAAYERVRRAECAGEIDLVTNHHDRRILQALLTPRARSTLAAARDRETEWATVLLNGLGMREIACTVQILRVIRQRLARDERELRERERQLKHDRSDFR
jgi:DNA-binding MarR family transcriptional regulator